MIIGPGPFGFEGVLRRVGPYFVLQTDRGYLFLCQADNMPANAPPLQSKVAVSYGRGKIIAIRLLTPPPNQTK